MDNKTWEEPKKKWKDWCFDNKRHLGRMCDTEAIWELFLKDFLESALDSQKKLLIEEIPKRKMHSKGCPRFMDDDYICSCGASDYNKAIEDVIKQLKD